LDISSDASGVRGCSENRPRLFLYNKKKHVATHQPIGKITNDSTRHAGWRTTTLQNNIFTKLK
jgi:hypothetical protein